MRIECISVVHIANDLKLRTLCYVYDDDFLEFSESNSPYIEEKSEP